MNMVPWGGPTLRAASSLQVDVTDLYNPIIIPQIAGLLFVLLIAWYLGRQEAQRLGFVGSTGDSTIYVRVLSESDQKLRRPHLFWFNIITTIVSIVCLVTGLIPPALVFMLAGALVLMINYPKLSDQKERVDAHAKSAIMMASILLAAGIFTGIMKESGMIAAIGKQAVNIIPDGFGSHLPVIMAILSMPLSFVFDPDSFYFGFLPIIAEVGSEMGLAPVTLGQAAILGQMTTGFPLSPLTPTTFLLIGLARIDLADHQRFTFKYAFLTTLIMTIIAIIIGVLPI
jgi:CitMHS family citrate-Mg2+:H+ or citrate-Ca2+:H+ symporter